MKREDILRKIKGLFALAEDNKSDAESHSAMLQAKKLMAKHSIELSEIDEEQKKNNIVSYRINEPKTVHWYERHLANIVADNFKVKLYFNGSGKYQTLSFYGYEADCHMAREIFFMLYEAFMFHSKEHVDLYYMTTGRYIKRTRELTKEVKESYMIGFINGLKRAFKEQYEELVQEFGLVVVTPKEVVEQFDLMTSDWKKKDLGSRSISNIESYTQGLEKGSTQSTKKLGKIGE